MAPWSFLVTILGKSSAADPRIRHQEPKFDEMASSYPGLMNILPEGHGVDKRFPDILYVPENARFDLHNQTVRWCRDGGESVIKLLPKQTYVRPTGTRLK